MAAVTQTWQTGGNPEIQSKFGSAKGISSDMYFGRGLHAEDENAGARASQFTGQSSISSAQYFGHPEEDQGYDGSGGHGAGHLGRAPSSGTFHYLH